ncbi:hypothetical protein [Pseudomonas vanderleydeniana]|uniref:Uncharacterized protein n=1 Tax=Pseudomonas vanderleydeniana TaxID=2745495 RepID=A0A9E6TPJ5_9PSED|nr:hypothetical protein [Pseudomonas vanderleydeniana]QXI25874.1 hypothetical protein HU752_018055 [Pseudomonas vanderleydeniana]
MQIAQGVAHVVQEAEVEYSEQLEKGGEALSRFLPPPDLNKHVKQVWMLPNLTSFTSIYARMNRYYGRRLAGIRVVHDQQLEVENIRRRPANSPCVNQAGADRCGSKCLMSLARCISTFLRHPNTETIEGQQATAQLT